MAYLYLNFMENLEKGSKSWDDFYSTSLSDQYEVLKRKLGGRASDTLQEFMAAVFPSQVNKNYYISMPSFDRRMKEDRRGISCIYNIVIRPQKDSYLSYAMPDNYDVIAIGDVTFGKITDVTIKGIELIDTNVAKFGEKIVSCMAASAFAKKTISTINGSFSVSDYGTRDLYDTVLTNDFINALTNDVYPVANPEKALRTLANWQKYLEFRKYYLGKQSERCENLTNVAVCNSFMVTKEVFKRNADAYEGLLLDGVEQFAKGEQIILSKEVSSAVEFPLICVFIEKNRKEVLSDALGRDGKGKPKFEVALQRYTRESMGLSVSPPSYDDKGNYRGSRSYLLGERYLFAHKDIEPDLSGLERKYNKDCLAVNADIDARYWSIIDNAINQFIMVQEPIFAHRYEKKLSEYAQSLAEALENDIASNNDKTIASEFQNEIDRRTAPYKVALNKIKEDFNQKANKIKLDKLSSREKDKRLEELQSEVNYQEKLSLEEINKIKKLVELREFYIERNTKLVDSKRKNFAIKKQADLDNVKKEKKSQLEYQYKEQREKEKNDKIEELKKVLQSQKSDKIERETVRRYQIYFRPDNAIEKFHSIEKQMSGIEAKYLTYDNRAEKAKIERQEKALNSLLNGYVKNPFLPTYLFSPETLSQTIRNAESEPEWCLESLNDRQKLAVKGALASESLFLLQGPPGTGKTQVIAEITAQLAKQGKKVLISSETHKAIDNVFERFPKIPEIRPLRLIPSQNGKETNYSPEKLVDNFYKNISGNLEKQISRYEHFEETKLVFDEQMQTLRNEYERLLKLKKQNNLIEREREKVLSDVNKFNTELEQLRRELSHINEEIEEHRRTIKLVESYRFASEGVKEKYIESFKSEVQKLLLYIKSLKDISLEKIGELARVDVLAVKEELVIILSEDKLVALKARQQELRRLLSDLRDPDTDEAPKVGGENYDTYKKYQNELSSIGNEIRAVQDESSFDFSASLIYNLVPTIVDNKEKLRQLPEDIAIFKAGLQSIVNKVKTQIDDNMRKALVKRQDIDDRINDSQLKISESKKSYEELSGDANISEYGELNSALKLKITRFFRDFNIVTEYDSDNLETAFKVILDEWDKIERDYRSARTENNNKIPMYKDIVKYLSQEDILEEDRQAYTRELYNCANVFGITCTSRDKFTKNQLLELGKYGIESVDIRAQGIDVVIIDEVSKSSFLDLLMPILYGKTVILVGDHRQLPPMYDLRHMRKDDFEGLDDNIISKEINDNYTASYEECFFKTLYESVPEGFRVMLNKQYRCHSHIMEVFNHFYGGNKKGLIVGKKQQDDEKEHGLNIKINGSTVIDSGHHIYFVDCDKNESSAYEGSTSKVNEQEAEVVIKLLAELDKASNELVKNGKSRLNKDKKIDERLSVGVICTYGDQAGLIKKKRKYQQFTGFSNKQDEKLIISTVDDFQGDERDIIIVSMVRNPSGVRFDADFIKKFERINVALSRARKLLIIVGARQFLTKTGVIDLPDLDGNHALDKTNFHVYKEIIDTIYFRGRVLAANDIIGE